MGSLLPPTRDLKKWEGARSKGGGRNTKEERG